MGSGIFLSFKGPSTMIKHILTVVTLATAAVAASPAHAELTTGSMMVRVRAVNMHVANDDATGLKLSVNDKNIPDIDFSYFLSKNVAVELMLTIPQQHDLSSGNTRIGTVTHLPPTLLLQYHFDAGNFKPYVGAGINYTRFTSVDLPAGIDIKRDSFGGALQVGVDIPLSGNLYLNLDVKKLLISTDVSSGGTNLGAFKVDPTLIGLGIGCRF